jgi:8-oxo-dGTP pyrophosphatase MutT (NUDIX family)
MMAEPAPSRRFSAGVVVVHVAGAAVQYLLLRAYKNWDFPKGLVEPGEQPLDAAVREVKEETTLVNLAFDWGQDYMDTGPYNKGKISRYYVARSNDTQVHLPINPELGFPEHQEARWVGFETALNMVSPRLKPVVHWASDIIAAPAAGAAAAAAAAVKE